MQVRVAAIPVVAAVMAGCCCIQPAQSPTASARGAGLGTEISGVAGSGTSEAVSSSGPVHVVDARGDYVGQYFAGGGGAPAMAMVKLENDVYFTMWVNGSQGQLRPMKGLVFSATSDCRPPYYIERHDEWQAPYPGALLGEVRTVNGRRLVFASRGKWQETSQAAQLYVVGPCTPTYGYQRAIAPVQKIYDISGRLTEPFSIR